MVPVGDESPAALFPLSWWLLVSGRRCKALKRAFALKHGRAPERDGGVDVYEQFPPNSGRWQKAGEVSEWRRVKRGRR